MYSHLYRLSSQAESNDKGKWFGWEIERIGPSYTIDTLRILKDRWPEAQLFLLMGEDQARALNQWRDGQQISQVATICVAAREDPTRSGGHFEPNMPLDERYLRLPVAPMAVSATEIRALVGTQQNVDPLVYEPVARYIEHHHLYQTH
jgi:nicotinate-nucleotide adenylyltransferase